MTEMITCPDCGIRYASSVATCPWCGRVHAGAGSSPSPASPAAASAEIDVPAETPQEAPQPTGSEAAAQSEAGSVAAAADEDLGWVLPREDPGAPDGHDEADTPGVAPDAHDAEDQQASIVADNEPSADPSSAPSVAEAAAPVAAAEPDPAPSATPPEASDEVEEFSMPDRVGPSGTRVMAPPRQASEDLREIMAGHHKRPRWQSWVINLGIVALLIVIGALIAEFVPLPFIDGGSGTTVASPSTVATAPTLPPTTAPTTTPTTTPETTTTSLTVAPPTVSVPTTVPFIEPIQPPVPVGDLQLGADALGPFQFGQNGDTVIGRLVASLDQPDIDMGVFPATGEYGACPGETIRVVRWGTLTIINRVAETGGESFAAYRVDQVQGEGPLLRTLSGVAVGDRVSALNAAYASRFTLEFVDGPQYEVHGTSGILLWGPLTSTDAEGVVLGIYSPTICET